MMSYGIPLIMLGGGGYTVANVARCWAYETGIALNKNFDINTLIPTSDPFLESYGPEHKLHVLAKNNVENFNLKDDIEKMKVKIF